MSCEVAVNASVAGRRGLLELRRWLERQPMDVDVWVHGCLEKYRRRLENLPRVRRVFVLSGAREWDGGATGFVPVFGGYDWIEYVECG